MRKIFILIAAITTALILCINTDLNALTFEINKDKPGVRDFALKNLRFSVDGENIIPRLPPSFYVITYFPDDIPVIAYKSGDKGKTPDKAHTIFLDKISGGKKAKSVKGPHGEMILNNPGRPPEKKLLSSYALWDGWVFIGNKKETLQNLLKLYRNPSDVAKTGTLTPSFKEWKEGGIRFWGDNSNNHLTNIFEAQKKTVLIPMVKDPKKIQAMAGAFTLTADREMRGKIMVKPVNQQALKDIEGDAKFISETLRRRLISVKSPYEGRINSTNGNIVYEVYIGDYGAAQGQIVRSK
ncbi:MAG: hypothetical protein HZA05_06210 [Nitrospirae bacterium]|nr:hypothetical protein [Nitrospirota bacterium]